MQIAMISFSSFCTVLSDTFELLGDLLIAVPVQAAEDENPLLAGAEFD